jgi:HD-GYP domain-containing protein (c-di-GMP phosphodiesterase class II)
MKSNRLRLVGIQGLDGRVWEFDHSLRIGRVPGVEIILDDASISRRHAEIIATDKGWSVRDLNSTNGTFINGLRIGRVDRRINPGDHIKFGNLIVVVNQIGEPSRGLEGPECRHIKVSQINEQTKTTDLSQIMARIEVLSGSHRVANEDCRAKIWGSSISTLKDLLTLVVQEAVDILEASTVFIALQDTTLQRLSIQVGAGVEIEPQRVRAPLSLAEKAFQLRESLLFDLTDAAPDTDDPTATPIRVHSTICALVRASGINLGILHLQRPPGKKPFSSDDLLVADALAAKAGGRIQSMQGSLNQQQQVVISSVIALAQAVELRDEYTGGHTRRVTDYALLLADELGLTERERYYLQVGTPLHDLGKIGIADAVLRKTGRLTPGEFETMKGHAAHGAHIVETIPELNPVVAIVRNHHERWDGTGYPDRLAGEKIPLLARVVAVVDVFDAMTSDRPYRPALPLDKAFDELRAGAGTQFDPRCVEAFCRVRLQVERILQENSTVLKTARPDEVARIREEMRQAGPLHLFAGARLEAPESPQR